MNKPQPGSIWTHRKHAPEDGKWHEYRVIDITESGKGPQDAPQYYTCIHTETGQWHDVMPAQGSNSCVPDDERCWLWPAVDEPHVIYRSTRDDGGEYWARPLNMFMDGRFAESED